MVSVYKSPEINESDSTNQNWTFLLDEINPTSQRLILLYVYRLPKFESHGFKVGMTTCRPDESFWHAIQSRIKVQEHELALTPERYAKYADEREVVYWGVCLDAMSESFKDYHVHNEIMYVCAGIAEKEQEWFYNVPLDELIDAFNRCRTVTNERVVYKPRKEQRSCIDKLHTYFTEHPVGKRFLLNCKMRFGKCFTTYKYCEENNINKVLILTFVPAVQESWEEDLRHIEKHYNYYTDANIRQNSFDLSAQEQPFVLFLSLQNYLGRDSQSNTVKDKIKKLQAVDFDLVVLDEYHFGAWNERTQETLEDFETEYQKTLKKDKTVKNVIEKFGITTKQTICLSGTPFKALARGEFDEENTFTYSYFDEQRNKYPHSQEDDFSVVNPDYAQFPDMKIFGYNMSRLFKGLTAELMSDDELLGNKYFSLNRFFVTRNELNPDEPCKFVYDQEIKYWLEIIKGRSAFGTDFPYCNPKMLLNNKHTLWLMPSVNSCIAMAELLSADEYFSRYQIVNLSDKSVGAGKKALDRLNVELKSAENTNKLGSIAITVNKLTLGVTVKPWMSIFVLKDLASPETYFQSIFRIQTPYVVNGEILKTDGYVFDFNLDRAAALLLCFAEREQTEQTTKMQIAKLICKYMPIYKNGNMSAPIGYDIFYNLAMYGDNRGVPFSRRIRDLSATTRLADDDVLSCMLNDPEVSDIIKRVFAHTKFQKSSTRTPPSEAPEGVGTIAMKKGQQDGHRLGMAEHKDFLDFDDEIIQKEFEKRIAEHLAKMTPEEYDDETKIYYRNGFIKGYEAGVNAPIKKLKCGSADGVKYAKTLRDKYGSTLFYEGTMKNTINNDTKTYLNNINNIPKEYRKMLYCRWYKESFLKAVQNSLKRPVDVEDCETVESANNVIAHLLARLFQFLYISVYRETTFQEVFNNADANVFLEAVGITKEDFETLNRYHAFQEDTLNSYIHEFFLNEDLGSSLDKNNEFVKKHYRNSFEWFGFTNVK